MITADQIVAFKNARSTFRALDHPLRRKILDFLTEPRTVTQIQIHLRIEQSVASNMLTILRMANIVCCVRQGKKKIYSINQGKIDFLFELAGQMQIRFGGDY